MKFYSAVVVCVLATVGSTDAFSPRNYVPNKSGLMVPSSSSTEQQQQQQSRPPMNMVAGGAERAYGQEYYEGASTVWIIWERRVHCGVEHDVLCPYLLALIFSQILL